ncbi:MAG: hypothetical protein K2H73_02680, partial [Treponemataceae bacterium]|nr:hypothetical protein [Treponemataceae bacterium]
MDTQCKNNRRISDVIFSLDTELRISDANRGFLQLINATDDHLNLSQFLDSADAEHLTTFLRHYSPQNKNHYCIITLLLTGHPLSCILHITEQHGTTYRVDLKELSYAQDMLEKTILENREHISLLNEFDVHFILHEGGKFKLRNTKDMTIDIYRGDKTDFIIYFIDFFKIDTENGASRGILNMLFDDIESGVSGKQYRLLLDDSSNILVKTLRSNARNSFVTMGLIIQSQVTLS